jgi:hypothetical protein
MYKGPYVFEFVGAFIRWSFLMLFVKGERNKKGLFKRILTGDNSTLGQRSWETFIPNFSIGVIVIVLVTLTVLYIVLP